MLKHGLKSKYFQNIDVKLYSLLCYQLIDTKTVDIKVSNCTYFTQFSKQSKIIEKFCKCFEIGKNWILG